MNWIKRILSAGTGSFIDKVSVAAKRFITTDKDRNDFALELEGLLQARDSEIEQTIRAELSAKERVMVAELQQSDNYTKRARPTVVYAGLAFIAFNYVLVPFLGLIVGLIVGSVGINGVTSDDLATVTKPLELPVEFWTAWGGICATWVIGRSAEKRGDRNKLVTAITGTKSTSGLLE